MDFRPTETPLGVPVLTAFEVNGRRYVVDVEGSMFFIDTHYEDPDMWCWLVMHLL